MGAKVLGTFAPEERKFQGCESSMERKFLDFSLPGSESSLYGLFAPGNESAEERKARYLANCRHENFCSPILRVASVESTRIS